MKKNLILLASFILFTSILNQKFNADEVTHIKVKTGERFQIVKEIEPERGYFCHIEQEEYKNSRVLAFIKTHYIKDEYSYSLLSFEFKAGETGVREVKIYCEIITKKLVESTITIEVI